MKRIKNMLKKGGIADIVTLMIIVGLVIALIVAVVLPIVKKANGSGSSAESGMGKASQAISSIMSPASASSDKQE